MPLRLRRTLRTAVLLALVLALVPVTSARTPARAGTAPEALGTRVAFGAWAAGMTNDPSRFAALESEVGAPLDVASYFYGYGDEFPASIERGFADGGTRDVLLSWDMGPYDFRSWASGAHDDYLRRIGRHAAAYPYEVHVRPWPEMNGDWQDFQPTTGTRKRHGGTPAEFVAAWRHVVTTVRAAGGTNVRWVFNPTTDVYAGTTDVRTIWPGREYVDVLGLDGYNWGSSTSWGSWQSFDQVFRAQYDRLTGLAPDLPVWVCEVSSAEPVAGDPASADKGAWIDAALASTAFPRITTLVWFDEDKERDWRLTSSPSALTAIRSWRSPTRGVACAAGTDCSEVVLDPGVVLGTGTAPVTGALVPALTAVPGEAPRCDASGGLASATVQVPGTTASRTVRLAGTAGPDGCTALTLDGTRVRVDLGGEGASGVAVVTD